MALHSSVTGDNMKKILVLLVLGTLALPAVAQTADEITVRGYASDRPIASRVFQNEMKQYSGIYQMSNGQMLEITQSGSRLLARLGNGAPRELLAFTSGDLVAPDRSMRITPERDFSNYFIGDIELEVNADAVAGVELSQPLRLVSMR